MEIITVNGVNVYPFTSEDDLLSFIDDKKGILVAINAGKIHKATDQTRAIINNNIGYCDGMGAVIALKKKGATNVIKIAGCELWLKIVEKFYWSKTFYLVGSKPKVIEDVVVKLKNEYQNINIIGYRDGYVKSDQERQKLIDDIVTKKPDVVFIAMGSPKQELLMEEMKKRHDAIYQGLGGSFDVYIGHLKRAPKWFIQHNLEGFYRMVTNFSIIRLKRYMSDIRFIIYLYKGRY